MLIMTINQLFDYYMEGKNKTSNPYSDEFTKELLWRLERVVFSLRISKYEKEFKENECHLKPEIIAASKFEMRQDGGGINILDIWYIPFKYIVEDIPGESIINDKISRLTDEINNLMEQMGEVMDMRERVKERWKIYNDKGGSSSVL